MRAANGVIIGTPVHWFTMSSHAKNLLDYLTILEVRGFELENTVVGCIATCDEDGGQKTALDILGALNHMGAVLPPYASVFVNTAMARKSEARWMEKDVQLLGSNVARMAKLVRSEHPPLGLSVYGLIACTKLLSSPSLACTPVPVPPLA